MALVALLADVHVGNHKRFAGEMQAGVNERCRLVLGALGWALRSAVDEGAAEIVIAGDLFDTDRPTPQVITQVRDTMRWPHHAKLPTHGGGVQRITLVCGNHDQTSPAGGDHALGPLASDRVFIGGGVYGIGGGPPVFVSQPYHPSRVERWFDNAEDGRFLDQLLVLHAGIADAETPEYLRGAEDSIRVDKLASIARRLGCVAVAAGNWHWPKLWAVDPTPDEDVDARLGGLTSSAPIPICQIGCLAPTGFDNEGHGYGTMAYYDTEARTFRHVVVPGPRFLKFNAVTLDGIYQASAGSTDQGNVVFVRIEAARQEKKAAEDLLGAMKADGVAHDGEVVLLAEDTRAAAHAAADAVVSALGSLEGAVRAYVSKMDLADGVDREQVASLAIGLLK